MSTVNGSAFGSAFNRKGNMDCCTEDDLLSFAHARQNTHSYTSHMVDNVQATVVFNWATPFAMICLLVTQHQWLQDEGTL